MNLVNLCLSRDPTKNLESAYTPMFKEFDIPRGSFGVDKGILLEESSRAEDITLHEDLQKRHELVVKGSKMEALDWSTNSLLKAATELETEIRKETKYWEEILSISGKGWSLQRTRGNTRNAPYAVHYGLPEGIHADSRMVITPLTCFCSQPSLQITRFGTITYEQRRWHNFGPQFEAEAKDFARPDYG